MNTASGFSTSISTTPMVVTIKNRQSGMVLDHYASKRIEAFGTRTRNRNCQWRRIVVANGYVVFKNVGTGSLLGQYPEEPLRANDVDIHNANCQWKELPIQDADGSGGFAALVNRATGNALDHYREQSIQAYTGQVTTLSQHWALARVAAARPPATSDLDKYAIVAFINRATGNALDHYAGQRIEAYTAHTSNENHQWFRIPMGYGFFAYKNVFTGKVLEHYYGESVQAFTTITHLPSHQWQEVSVENDGVFVALVNGASGKALHHCHRLSIQACAAQDFYSDRTAQWTMTTLRDAAVMPVEPKILE